MAPLLILLLSQPKLELKAKPEHLVRPGIVHFSAKLHGDYCPSSVEMAVEGVVRHKWSVSCDERVWSEDFAFDYGTFRVFFSVFGADDKREFVDHVSIEVGQ